MQYTVIAAFVMAVLCGCSGEPATAPEDSNSASPVDGTGRPATRPRTGTPQAAIANQVESIRRGSTHGEALEGAAGHVLVSDTDEIDMRKIQKPLNYVRDSLPLLDVSTASDAVAWHHLELNKRGAWFDAVRFRCPDNAGTDLFLCVAFPGVLPEWSIIPAEGDSPPSLRDNRHVEWNADIAGTAFKDENVAVFHASSGTLKPGAEYYLWFCHRHSDAAKRVWRANVALRFLPAGTAAGAATSKSIAELMGIELRVQEFSTDPEGVRRALAFANSLWRRGAADNIHFARALWTIAPALPELAVGRDKKMVWNSIELNRSGTGMEAYRFRSPLAEPANLQYAVAEPRAAPLSYHLMNSRGDLRFSPFQVEIDLAFDGVALPADNAVYFQMLAGGQLLPEQEYIVWVGTSREARHETVIGLHASPDGPIADPLTARHIAADAGLQLPETVTPERRKVAFARCRDWCLWHGDEQNYVLRQGLQSVRSALPEVRVSSGNDPVVWNSLKLNVDGIGFDAFRFRSPLSERAELYCALGDSRELRWQAIPAVGYQLSVTNITKLAGVTFEGASVTSEGEFTLGASTGGRRGGIIEPGREYIVWFLSPTETRHRPLELAIRLLPGSSGRWFNSGHEIASQMGLKRAPASASPGSILLGSHENPVVDLAFHPDGARLASLDSGGNVRVWNVPGASLETTLALPSRREATSLRISPDGRYATLGLCSPAAVAVWDLASQKLMTEAALPHLRIEDIAYSPDGSRLAAFCTARNPDDSARITVSVLETANWKEQRSRLLDGITGRRLAWPFPDTILIAGYGDPVKIGVGVQTKARLAQLNPSSMQLTVQPGDQQGEYSDLALAITPEVFAAVHSTNAVVMWNGPKLQDSLPVSVTGSARRIALSPDGRRLAVAGMMPALENGAPWKNWAIQCWDMESRKLRFLRPTGEEETTRLAMSHDGRWIASSHTDQTVRLWDTAFPVSVAQTNSIGMKFVRIPAGTFQMGSASTAPVAADDERPPHQVSLTRPFLLSMYEVTVGQFRQFVTETGYVTSAEKDVAGGWHIVEFKKGFEQRPEFHWQSPGFPQTDDHPVVQISWTDAQAFCKWLSDKEGKTYRLPTEAEWEYSCRGGSAGAGISFEASWNLKDFANLPDRATLAAYRNHYPAAVPSWDDTFAFSAPVGSFAPNSFGLYDMLGNAIEWCSDWYDSQYYAQSPENDPQGPANGQKRIQRGGTFLHQISEHRAARRVGDGPDQGSSVTGFRPVIVIDP